MNSSGFKIVLINKIALSLLFFCIVVSCSYVAKYARQAPKTSSINEYTDTNYAFFWYVFFWVLMRDLNHIIDRKVVNWDSRTLSFGGITTIRLHFTYNMGEVGVRRHQQQEAGQRTSKSSGIRFASQVEI